MIRPALVTAVAVVAGIVASAAQSPPDFSGVWIADVAVPAAPNAPGVPPAVPQRPDTGALSSGDMGAGWGSPLTITQTQEQLVVEVRLFSNYDLQPQPRFVYALDGAETRNTFMPGHATQVRTSRATWEGQTLRIVTRFPGVDPATGKPFTTEVTSKLSLRSPSELVIETTRSGVLGGQATTGSTTYRKK
ncbi:MAG TPA: hypothetical protein VFS23_16455 [Vicinamibacterales bacterium]|nr:hypothetical protein [Vicinamibacterales bacterium]